MQKLISVHGSIDLFDLSEEIYVSIPTIESDIKAIQKRLSIFSVSLKRNTDYLTLEGDEPAKQRLINSILQNNSYESFLLKNEVCLLSSDYNHEEMKKNIINIEQ